MPNRSMAVKHARGVKQRTEYAIQSHFAEVSAPARPMMQLNGKLIPRQAQSDAEMIAAYEARKKHERLNPIEIVRATTTRTRFAWSR